MEKRNNSITAAALMLGVPVERVEALVEQHRSSQPYNLVGRYEDEIRNMRERIDNLNPFPDAAHIHQINHLQSEVASMRDEVQMLRELIAELNDAYEKAVIFLAENPGAVECAVPLDREKAMRLNKLASLCGTKKTP